MLSSEFLAALDSKSQIGGGIEIEGQLSIKGIKNRSPYILISNVTFQNFVTLYDGGFTHKITFADCIFQEEARFSQSEFYSVHFVRCLFKNAFSIENCTIQKLTIVETIFNIAAKLSYVTSTSVELSSIDNQTINIYYPEFTYLKLSEISNRSEINITATRAYNDDIPTSFIKNFSFECLDNFDYKLTIQQINIDSINLYGTNSGEITIEKSFCRILRLGSFINKGKARINSLKVIGSNSSLQLFNSTLGKGELLNVDFSEFNSVDIVDSHFEDIVASNIIWCNRLENKEKIKTYPSPYRENYRQLKNIVLKSNNKPEEIKFYGYEMDAYYREKERTPGDLDEKIILWTNKVTNKHGLSWSLALKEVLISNLIFYTLIKACLLQTNFNASLVIKETVNYIEFINPIHKFGDVFSANNSDLARLLDVISRLLSAYLIYQFLRAFRRFVKN